MLSICCKLHSDHLHYSPVAGYFMSAFLGGAWKHSCGLFSRASPTLTDYFSVLADRKYVLTKVTI